MKDTTDMQYDKVNVPGRRYSKAAINRKTYIEYRFLYIMSTYTKMWIISVERGRQLNTKSSTIKNGCPRRNGLRVIVVPEVRENGNRLAYVKWMTIPLTIGVASRQQSSSQYRFTFTFRAKDDRVQSIQKLMLNLTSNYISFHSSLR
jgi:hypothetical protein